jgi:hypothetical protein
MSGRVAWERYEGNDVEAVVAMMVNREHPNSVRITPSRGDGGVDILDRRTATDGGDVVYQVKRYTRPLTAAQKAEVSDSLERVFDPEKRDSRWQDLRVTEWRLVTPWDPTPEAYTWLQGLAAPYSVTVYWDGLTHVEQLAAKYPDVIDYYLHGGRSAIQQAYQNAMALMGMSASAAADEDRDDGDGSPAVPGVVARIEEALGVLRHDPHYLYELRFGHGDPPIVERPALVFSWFRIDPATSTWQAVDVLARCAASLDERPITVQGKVRAEEGSDLADQLKDFAEFGTPFTSTAGAFDGVIDAPGGLGGDLVDATLRISPVADDDLGEGTQLRLEVLDPDGGPLVEVNADRIERSGGKLGLRVVLAEVNGIFELTQRFILRPAEATAQELAGETAEESVEEPISNELAGESRQRDVAPGGEPVADSRATFSLQPFTGKPVASVRPALDFLAAYRSPNRFRVSRRHAPAGRGISDAIPALVDPEVGIQLEGLAMVVRVLDTLQQHTDVVINVPDLDELAGERPQTWAVVVAVLEGNAVETQLRKGTRIDLVLESDASPPDGSFTVPVPLDVVIGDQTVNFGTGLMTVTDPELLDELDAENGGKLYRYRASKDQVTYTPQVDPPEVDA